jgi:hypothetical protein
MWINHCIEWSCRCWISIKHVEISIIFFSNYFTKSFFCFSRKVLKIRLINTCFMKKFHSFFEIKFYNWNFTLKIFERILLLNSFNFFFIASLNTLEYVN